MLKTISASALAMLAIAVTLPSSHVAAQQGYTTAEERPSRTRARVNDAYRPGPDQPGLGVLGSDGRAAPAPYGGSAPYGAAGQAEPAYAGPPTYSAAPAPSYGGQPGYNAPGYSAPGSSSPAYGAPTYGAPSASYGGAPVQAQGYGTTPPPYQAPYGAGAGEVYRPATGRGGFGQPYAPPPGYDEAPYDSRRPYHSGEGYRAAPPPGEYRSGNTFSIDEIKTAGHGFFGSITQGLASVIEHAHRKKGRPNGYILGEEAGGAFIGGLRYGRGRLYTKDAGVHNIYWQGPSIGFDAGADGSKIMILVYNLRDIGEVYERFGGVDGSAYVVGGVGMTFMSRDHVVMAPIRSGVGLRFGANVGYLKFTTQPTWNPF